MGIAARRAARVAGITRAIRGRRPRPRAGALLDERLPGTLPRIAEPSFEQLTRLAAAGSIRYPARYAGRLHLPDLDAVGIAARFGSRIPRARQFAERAAGLVRILADSQFPHREIAR